METLNERIKEVRKDLGLSQKELAERIGISQRSVSWGEQPGNNVPDSTVKALCMAFHISESWLRNGTGPMYEQQPTFSLDQFVKEHGATSLELEILKAYFELDPEIRKVVFDHFKARLSHAVGSVTEKPPLAMAARGGKVAPPQEPIDEDEFEAMLADVEQPESL